MFFITVLLGIVFFYIRIRYTQNIVTSSDYNTYDNYYVIITGNRDTDYWKSIYAGARAEAEQHSVNVEMMGEGLDRNLTKEDYLRIAISSSADGIIIEGDDNPEIQELLIQADAAGIPVVTVSEDSPNSGRKSFIGISSNNLGKEFGNQIVEYANGSDADSLNVMVLIDKGMTESNQTVIMTAIRESLVENGLSDKINLESKIVSSDVDYAAEEEIRDIFVGKGEIPDIMVCLSEQNTLCALQTVVDHNKVGQVEIFGYYMSDTISTAIKKNIIRSSIVVDTEQLGMNAVKAIDEYKDTGYVSEIYLIDTKLANSDNITSFEQQGGDEND